MLLERTADTEHSDMTSCSGRAENLTEGVGMEDINTGQKASVSRSATPSAGFRARSEHGYACCFCKKSLSDIRLECQDCPEKPNWCAGCSFFHARHTLEEKCILYNDQGPRQSKAMSIKCILVNEGLNKDAEGPAGHCETDECDVTGSEDARRGEEDENEDDVKTSLDVSSKKDSHDDESTYVDTQHLNNLKAPDLEPLVRKAVASAQERMVRDVVRQLQLSL